VTDDAPRPHRSVLYLPGANARALEKAKTLPADALILDLEDAVAPEAKDYARSQVCDAVRAGGYGQRVVTIRVNGLGTAWHAADLAAAGAAGPAAVVVPKVNTAADVLRIQRELDDAGADATVAIWAMIETPSAILHVTEIASATPRLTTLVMGTNDLLSELRALHTPQRAALVGALSQCVLAARACGTVILDGVYNDVTDVAGFEIECRQGRMLGFDGKTLIHPGQIQPCNRAFAPSDDDITHAHRVIAAFDESLRAGSGVATVDGRLIENLHVTDARRVLALAAALG
jgi:citrate lyase subunit beta/citryl-CoA lyase